MLLVLVVVVVVMSLVVVARALVVVVVVMSVVAVARVSMSVGCDGGVSELSPLGAASDGVDDPDGVGLVDPVD